ncbi:MAG TPA: PAS domain S-box protein [Vicinamibacterales bacterium]|nr:PAS domain S-box protein [Vicinamibacterales bacterium]
MSTGLQPEPSDMARRLAEAEAVIEALLAGQIDAVVDPAHSTPLLLAKAQESLRQSEERYRHIVENTNEGIWLSDSTHTTAFMNRRMAQMLRCEEDMGVGRSPLTFLDEPTKLAFAHYPERPAPYQSDVEFRRTDGTRFWGHLDVVPMFESDGCYAGTLAMVRDISERRAAELALRQTTRDLVERTNVLEMQGALLKEQAAILDLPADAIIVRTLKNQVAFWSRGARGMYGWSSAEALGRRVEELIDADCPETFEEICAALFIAGHWEGEGSHRCKDGTHIDVASRWTVQRDGTGAPVRILSISHDISARRKSEIERARLAEELKRQTAVLRETEARTTYALSAARMGVWEIDPKTRLVTWSGTMPSLYGVTAAEAPRSSDEFLQLVHPDDRVMLQNALEAAVANRTELRIEFRAIWPDGTVHWYSGLAQVIYDEGGTPVRVLGVDTEISERKSLEAQFQQSQKMEAVGQLAGGVAHDFNNLMTVVLGYSEFVIETLGVSDPRRADLDEVVRAGQRATALTRQLLAFSRKQVLQPTNVDLNALVLGMEDMLARLIGEDIIVEHTLAPDLWAVRADVGQLEQVLMNLTVNARDAMPTGGRLSFHTSNVELEEPDAHSFGIGAGCYVLLAVADNGTGMTESVRQRLFEPFFTTKLPGKGTGLGLATVYGILKQTGGTVSVTSTPGAGTTFDVYLPCVVEGDPQALVPAAPERGGTSRGHETILIVEDEDGVRLLTRRILEQSGYRVFDASDAAHAEAVFAKHAKEIDLLLTDVVMPGISGAKLFARLQEQQPGLKVLYLSGYTQGAIVEQGPLGPGIELLQKPFTAAALNERVREVIEGPTPQPAGRE